jgi:hypothetical protein
MTLRTIIGLLAMSAALTACDDDKDAKADGGADKDAKAKQVQADTEKLNKRCEQLGNACGSEDKHKQKITEECKAAGKTHIEKGCTDKAIAVYDCFEKELCVKENKIWAMDDFRVLTTRHKKCVEQRKAGNDCVGVAEAEGK